MSASPPEPETRCWTVEAPDDGQRLDLHVATRLDTARNRVQRWIRSGHVRVDGTTARRPATSLTAGQTLEVDLESSSDERPPLTPEDGPLRVLWQDEHLLLVDKPAGLVVHPAPGHERGTLCHRALAIAPEMARVGHPGRPGIVHRLDAGTSGVMVLARTAAAYDALSRNFAERRVDKWYLALAHGLFRESQGRIDHPIGRHPRDRKRMAVVADGREARTDYRVLDAENRVSLVLLRLHTGRTHQIRVHLKEIRHPLLGDATYGEQRWKEVSGRGRGAARSFARPALHAWRLGFRHPTTGDRVEAAAELADDLRELWTAISDRDPTLPGPDEL